MAIRRRSAVTGSSADWARGAFGRVYLTHDDDLDRLVAIKVPSPGRISNARDVSAYQAEARALARLDHPHIVPVFDVGRTEDGLCYVVSKYIDGCDLSDRIPQERPSPGEAAELGPEITAIYVEAAPEDTEARLFRGLRKAVPELADGFDLIDAMAALRRGRVLPAGRKVLLVIDQFEQWLFARRAEAEPELVSALRQCDGEHLQAIMMVRDDFEERGLAPRTLQGFLAPDGRARSSGVWGRSAPRRPPSWARTPGRPSRRSTRRSPGNPKTSTSSATPRGHSRRPRNRSRPGTQRPAAGSPIGPSRAWMR